MRTNQIVKASLFTLILALMAIGTMAIAEVMKGTSDSGSQNSSTIYHFTGTTQSQANNPTFWSDDPSDAQNCDGIPQLPCSVELEEGIESYLEGKSSEDVMSDPAVSKRSQ